MIFLYITLALVGSAGLMTYGPATIQNGVSTIVAPGRISSSLRYLDPKFKKKIETVIENLEEKGHRVRIQTTYRSSKRQDFLYNMSQLGQQMGINQKFTNAKGGQSCHNHSTDGSPSSYAVDMWGYTFGPELLKSTKAQEKHAAFFKDLGREVKKLSLGWGGNFSKYNKSGRPTSIWTNYDIGWDPPHVYDKRCSYK